MSYLSKMLAVLATLLAMTGCGVQQYTKHTNVAGYPYRYADFDYKYAWKTTASDHDLLIEGVIKNVRYAIIDSVLVTVTVLDKDGKMVTRESGFAMPQQSREGDVCNFSLLLGNFKPATGDVFQFLVHYTGNDGDNRSRVNWYSSFKVDALNGTAIRPPSGNSDEW